MARQNLGFGLKQKSEGIPRIKISGTIWDKLGQFWELVGF